MLHLYLLCNWSKSIHHWIFADRNASPLLSFLTVQGPFWRLHSEPYLSQLLRPRPGPPLVPWTRACVLREHIGISYNNYHFVAFFLYSCQYCDLKSTLLLLAKHILPISALRIFRQNSEYCPIESFLLTLSIFCLKILTLHVEIPFGFSCRWRTLKAHLRFTKNLNSISTVKIKNTIPSTAMHARLRVVRSHSKGSLILSSSPENRQKV